MKTSPLFRSSLVCLLLLLSATMAMAQKVVYTEAPVIAKSGYWNLVTDQSSRDYTMVQFYNDQHELLYEERLEGLCLAPCKSRAAHRRVARLLGATLQQVQRMQSNSMVSTKLSALNRHTLRAYAAR